MFKQAVSLLLVGLFLNLFFYTSSAWAAVNSVNDKKAKFALKIKNGINKLGAGKEVRVKLKMKDGTKLNGYISKINENNFVVVDNSGKNTSIPYSDVRQVTGKNNLNGKEIAIFAAAILLLVLIAASGVV